MMSSVHSDMRDFWAEQSLGPISLVRINRFVDQLGVIYKTKNPHRQAMCELERISDGPIARDEKRRGRWMPGDESCIFARRKPGLCPEKIWLRNGGSLETLQSGFYLRVPPGTQDCHWDMTAEQVKANRKKDKPKQSKTWGWGRDERESKRGGEKAQKVKDTIEFLRAQGVTLTNEVMVAVAEIKGNVRSDANQQARALYVQLGYHPDHEGVRYHLEEIAGKDRGLLIAERDADAALRQFFAMARKNEERGFPQVTRAAIDEILKRIA